MLLPGQLLTCLPTCIPVPAGLEFFIQRCEVQPFTLTINYRPHHVDLAALSRYGPG